MTDRDIILFQYSSSFLVPHNPVLDYYRAVYSRTPGFFVGSHTMEIPTWIARVGKLFANYEVRFVNSNIGNLSLAISLSNGDQLFTSVTDVALPAVLELIDLADELFGKVRGRLFLGGYISPDQLPKKDFVTWVDSPAQLVEFPITDFEDTGDYDYSHFIGESTIPRLALSTGCWYQCHFCTIDRTVTELPEDEIWKQVRSFIPLSFQYIYIDDKTFGQAKNHTLLQRIYWAIREYNPSFRGFIVQTTVPVLLSNARKWYRDLFVRYAEVGVEYPDDDFLKAMQKPYTLESLDKLVDLYRETDSVGLPKLIPNIIFGLPEPYNNTAPYDWLVENRDVFAWINPYILSLYESQKGNVGVEKVTAEDARETSFHHSWINDPEDLERYVVSILKYINASYQGEDY